MGRFVCQVDHCYEACVALTDGDECSNEILLCPNLQEYFSCWVATQKTGASD